MNIRPRTLAFAVPTLLLIVVVVLLTRGTGGSGGGGLFRPTIDEKATLAVLRSESLSFLVTRRTATQIVVDYSESDWLGDWHGVLWATVSWRWGVDLSKLTEKDLRREGDGLVCRLPEPQLLDFGVDPGSVGFMSKSTALPKLKDFFRGGWQRAVLEERLRGHAMKFAADQKLCPTRAEIVRQLNDASGTILKDAGVSLRFE